MPLIFIRLFTTTFTFSGQGIWIRNFNHDVKRSCRVYDVKLFSGEVSSQAHLDRAKEILMDTYLAEVDIPEFFLLDVDKILDEFEAKMSAGGVDVSTVADADLKIIQDPEYRRLNSTIDFNLAIKHFGHWSGRRDGLKKKLEELNQQKHVEVRLCFIKIFLIQVELSNSHNYYLKMYQFHIRHLNDQQNTKIE